jgi:hypothetical protein
MKMITDFVDRFRDFDVIILSRFNPIHPEILANELEKPVKILGFIDDPYSSYTRGIPYLWAVDGAFYISPSYDEHSSFPKKLEQWGSRHNHWWPLCCREPMLTEASDDYFVNRSIDLVYVGNAYGVKIDRLATMKRHFGDRMRVHGRWPLAGYYGFVRGLMGKPFYFHKVNSLTAEERSDLYRQARIGFNQHLSPVPRETGNLRMYEIPAHGMLQVCDKAGMGVHSQIFRDMEEAVYYDDIDDAIEKIEYYLKNEEERLRIAKAGFARAKRDYDWEIQLKQTLDWAVGLKNTTLNTIPH